MNANRLYGFIWIQTESKGVNASKIKIIRSQKESYYPIYTKDCILDELRPDDEEFDFGDVKVVVDRASYFYLDDPLKIDYSPSDQAFRLRSPTHVIQQKFYI